MFIPIPTGSARRAAQRMRLEREARMKRAAELGHQCPYCGAVDMPEPARRGNLYVHILAYMTWIIPGIIYGMWRNRGRYQRCRYCRRALSGVPSGVPG